MSHPFAHRRRRAASARDTLLRVVLAIATASTGIALAAAAYEAPRARERLARAALRDYAHYYAATAVDQASWEILRTLRARLLVRQQLLSLRRGESPSADAWARSGTLVDECRCVPALSEALHFRSDAPLDSLGIRWSAPPDPRVERWLARAVADWLRGAPAREEWTELLAGEEAPGIAVSAYARRDPGDGTVAVFGYAADVRGILAVAMEDMMGRAPLFPSALDDPRANPTLVRLVLRTGRGDTLFASAPVAAAAGAPVTIPRHELGGLEASVIPTRAALALLAPARGWDAIVPVLATVFLVLAMLWVLLLRSLRRREALVQARGAFVATVSHELRTPLAQIMLFAERAREAPAADPEERRRSLDIVIREAERLAHLADNAIHVAAGSVRSVGLRRRPADLPTLIEEIVERFAPVASDSDVRIELTADEGLIADVDAAAVSQMALNLLDNALRHAPGTEVVRVLVRRRGLEAWLIVEDDGPGVPPSMREAVWDAFSRVDGDAGAVIRRDGAPSRGGSGIGLAVVRDLAAAHGGRAWAESADAGGARFVVAFPLAGVAGHGPAQPDAPDAATATALASVAHAAPPPRVQP